MKDLDRWIDTLFENPDMLSMGHGQREDDRNLGFGWLYYAVARIQRPKTAVVIGSWRGFVPLTIARGMTDNSEAGRLIFIDPSFVDDQWKDPDAVQQHFRRYGIGNIEHYCITTQDFLHSAAYQRLDAVDFLFVDGYHTSVQAQFDHEAFSSLLTDGAIVLFHDTTNRRRCKLYGEHNAFDRDVYRYIDALRQQGQHDIYEFPFFDGIAMVRKRRTDSPAASDQSSIFPSLSQP